MTSYRTVSVKFADIWWEMLDECSKKLRVPKAVIIREAVKYYITNVLKCTEESSEPSKTSIEPKVIRVG